MPSRRAYLRAAGGAISLVTVAGCTSPFDGTPKAELWQASVTSAMDGARPVIAGDVVATIETLEDEHDVGRVESSAWTAARDCGRLRSLDSLASPPRETRSTWDATGLGIEGYLTKERWTASFDAVPIVATDGERGFVQTESGKLWALSAE